MIFYKIWKASFWAQFGELLTQKFQDKAFSKKTLKSILNLYATVASCKKSEKLHAFIFDNTWKTSFWAPSEPLLTEQP